MAGHKFKCIRCGRVMNGKVPHNCVSGYTKKLEFTPVLDEDEKIKVYVRGSESNPKGVINALTRRTGSNRFQFIGNECGILYISPITGYIEHAGSGSDLEYFITSNYTEIDPEPSTLVTEIKVKSGATDCTKCPVQEDCPGINSSLAKFMKCRDVDLSTLTIDNSYELPF